MAEFLGQRKPRRFASDEDSGFNAFGKDVPPHRRQAAYEHCKSMGLTDSEDMWTCVNGMAEQIARDEPYEAMKIGMRYVDLTGTYRLIAVLCTAEIIKPSTDQATTEIWTDPSI